MSWPSLQRTGFSLIETLVTSAVIALFFGGLFASVQYSLSLIANSRAKLSALSLAHERIEYLRSLPYDSVGTIAGIPSGAIPQTSTTSLNGILFTERVLIQYVDDPADGVGAADSNGILADYKQVKVEYSWNLTGATSTASLISYIVPRSIETTAGGGTIRVNVFDAVASPLPGMTVRLLNTSGTSTIDVTRFTDATGAALFAGAPAGANYQIFVNSPGYSSDQTYLATTSNPNPLTPPMAVLDADVSTMNFQIDRLSDLILRTFSAVTDEVVEVDFSAPVDVASSTNVVVQGGVAELTESGGVYETTGEFFLAPFSPSALEAWGVASVVGDIPLGTEYRVRFYSSSTDITLIPNSDLPGNASGFTDRLIDLSLLDVGAYPALVVGVTLTTTDTSLTPTVEHVYLSARTGSTPLTNYDYTLRGSKVIGTDLSAFPIYKFAVATSSDSSGESEFRDIEWDTYRMLPGDTRVVARMCPSNPLSLSPDTSLESDAVLTFASANNLRVQVHDVSGRSIPGASLELVRSGFSMNRTADSCGQAFFSDGSIAAEGDYELTVSAPGFTTNVVSGLAVSGDTETTVILNE